MNVRDKVRLLIGLLAMGVGATELPQVAVNAASDDVARSGLDTRSGISYAGRWQQLEILAQSGRPPAN